MRTREVLLVAALALAACTSASDDGAGAGGSDPVSVDESGEEGGGTADVEEASLADAVATSEDGVLALSGPGAESASVRRLDRADWPEVATSYDDIDAVYELSPDGAEFDPPLTLRLTATGDEAGTPMPLVALADDDGVVELPEMAWDIDLAERTATITGEVPHFSTAMISYTVTLEMLPDRVSAMVGETFEVPLRIRMTAGRDNSLWTAVTMRGVGTRASGAVRTSGRERFGDLPLRGGNESYRVGPAQWRCDRSGSGSFAWRWQYDGSGFVLRAGQTSRISANGGSTYGRALCFSPAPTSTSTSSTRPGTTGGLVADPITAVLRVPCTTYTSHISGVAPSSVNYSWTGPNCGSTSIPSLGMMVWSHGSDDCSHEFDHREVTVVLVATSGRYSIRCTYPGAGSGTGPACSQPLRR